MIRLQSFGPLPKHFIQNQITSIVNQKKKKLKIQKRKEINLIEKITEKISRK